MKLPANRSLILLGLGAALATGLFVTPHAEAGTQMPPWKAQMYEASEAAQASAGSSSGDDSSVVTTTSSSGGSSGGFVSQADLDLVLLNWGAATPPVGLSDGAPNDGFQVSQNELDGVLLNWGNLDDVTPPAFSGTDTNSSSSSSSSGELGGVLLNWGTGTPPDLVPIGAPDPADEYGGASYDISTNDFDLDEGTTIAPNSPGLFSPVYSLSSSAVLGSFADSTSIPAVEIGVGQDDGQNSEPAAVAAVPEPASGLVLLSAAALSAVRRRRN